MADQLELLKQLQAIDGDLFRLRRQQQDKPNELEEVNARLATQDAKLKAAEERLKTLQMSQKEKEGELQTREAQIKKLQGQLFQLKTNKEYTVMQHEIDSIKADNSLLEEAIIKILEAIDQAAQDRQREQRQLADEQQRGQAQRARIEQEMAELDTQIARLERDRQAITPDVLPADLTVYERVLEIRDGLALVPLMNESCGGCHRRLPPQVISQVHLKAKLVTCESCNRILYFDAAHSKL